MRIGLYGFGSIGRLLAKVALERGHEIVAVIDIDPKLQGKDVGEILGIEPIGVYVTSSIDELATADVVLHATGSYLDKVYDQILSVIEMGLDVVSTCETLAYPYYRYPILARKLDEKAISYGVTVLGTGINPGFLLDTLLIVLSAPLPSIKKIKAVRSLDASKRRMPFQKKVGIGLKPEEFRKKLEAGELTGHVGYAESVLLIADAAGIQLSRVEEKQEPVVAEKEITIGEKRITAGTVIGIKGYGRGFIGDNEIIRIEFHAYVGANEYEKIIIEGKDYDITWTSSGTPGDMGTASILVSIAENITKLPIGLITMADIIPFKPFFSTK